MMSRNIKAALLSAFVFPGLGQIYKGCRKKGIILILAVNVVFVAAIAVVIGEIYQAAFSGNLSATPNPVMTAERILHGTPAITVLLALFACLWIYGVLDALFHRPKDRAE